MRALKVLGAELHHHPILVERVVDGGHQALAKGVVEHGIDLLRGDAELGRGIAVDDD